MTDPIIRIAARGDGVSESGKHVAGAVPGDVVQADGSIVRGPHHTQPPCRHFNACGGCQLQHADDAALRGFVTDRVVNAAEGQGVAIGTLLDTHLSPPKARRRVKLRGLKARGKVLLGYREARSHKVTDLAQCDVMAAELFALIKPFKKLLSAMSSKAPVDLVLTQTDQGVACALNGIAPEGLSETEALLDFARDLGLARLTLDQGYGPETMWEPEPATVTLAGVPVPFPDGAFLQATSDGEKVLIDDAREYLHGSATIADLFAGLGTFSFALAGKAKLLAVEAARDAHLACKLAAGQKQLPIHSLHRDLFRGPLQPDEASRFSSILLDPPRAGAKEQIAAIAQSKANRVAYISCNPSSWARDAKTLVDAGFVLEKLRPVGQFRWSTHVELTSYFTR